MLISNKKNIKYIVLFIILILFLLPTISLARVKPTNDFYVNDYAGLLDQETKQYIINCNVDLYEKTGAQVVVVTVKNLEGESLEEYATGLFREFGIGSKDKNNGVLLLLALEERQFRVEVGYGLEGALPDGKTGRIQDEYIIPYLKNNNWKDGIENGFNAVLQVIAEEYEIEISNSEVPTIVKKGNASTVQAIVLVVYIILVLFVFINSRRKRRIISAEVSIVVEGFLAEVGGFSGGGRRIFWWWRFISAEVEALEDFKNK